MPATRLLGRHNAGLRTITVRELRGLLFDLDQDQKVAFTYDYGDHCHTPAVDGITKAEVKCLTETAYSPSGFAVASEADEENADVVRDDNGDPVTVVVLS